MFGKRGILAMIFLAGGIVFLVLRMFELKKGNDPGSFYMVISSTLSFISMALIYIENRKSPKD